MFNPRLSQFLLNAQGAPSGADERSLPAVIVVLFLLLLSLLLNCTLLTVLWRLRKKLFEPPGTFYAVVLGLLLFTTLTALVQAAALAPRLIMSGGDPFPSTLNDSFFFLDMLADYGILGFSTLMAANRFSTFNLGCKCPVFRRPRLYALIVVVYAAVAACAAAPLAVGCSKRSTAGGALADSCPPGVASTVVEGVLTSIYYVTCLVSLQFYVRTYWLIKEQRGHLIEHEGHRRAPETVILKQAVLIFGLYVISLVISTLLPLLRPSPPVAASLCLLLSALSLALSAIFPGLFLVSARDMRREVASWLPCLDSSRKSLLPWRSARITSADPMTSRYRMKSLT